MIKNLAYVSILLAIITTVLYCCASGTIDGGNGSGVGVLSREATLSFRACEADDDCVYAQNGCCDCANGGESIAVNINQAAAFEALFECENVACTMRAAVIPCEQGTTKCELGVCEFTSDSGSELPDL